MRDINRIPIIIKRLAEVWMKNPDLRLGQLIINLTRDVDWLYNAEDEVLVVELEELYEELTCKN